MKSLVIVKKNEHTKKRGKQNRTKTILRHWMVCQTVKKMQLVKVLKESKDKSKSN